MAGDGGKMNGMNLFQRTRRSIKEAGLVTTINEKLVLRMWNGISDYVFDNKYGVETRKSIPLSKLTIKSVNKCNGIDYDPVNYFILRDIFVSLSPCFNRGNFVDFGSGKGRVMLLASQYGFEKIIGVEFSKKLCDICKNNLCKTSEWNERKNKFQIENIDAEKYYPNKNDRVFFFFNPFKGRVLDSVLDNIDASLREHERDIMLIYVMPVQAENFKKRYREVCVLKNIVETRIYVN